MFYHSFSLKFCLQSRVSSLKSSFKFKIAPVSNHQLPSYAKALIIRGGKKPRINQNSMASTKNINIIQADDGVDKEAEDDETDFELEDIDDIDVEENVVKLKRKFARSALFRQAFNWWDQTPPITQYLIGASIIATIWALIFNGNQWPQLWELDWYKTFVGFQIWRPFTSFLFLGPFGLNYILTVHYLWTYLGDLEKMNAKSPEDFIEILGFGIFSLLLGYFILGISPQILGHNLATYLVYIWSRAHEGASVNVMDIFDVKAELIPWFFCLQALVLEGEFPFADFFGILIGHIYQYLVKYNLLSTKKYISILIPQKFRSRYDKIKSEFDF